MRRHYLHELQPGPLGGERWFNPHDSRGDAHSDILNYRDTYESFGWLIGGDAATGYFMAKGNTQRTLDIVYVDLDERRHPASNTIERFRPNL